MSLLEVGSDERSASIVLNYVLVLAISTVLVTGLLVAGGTFVEDNRERVIHSELTVIGNHIAGNVEQVDRLASASQENVGDDPDVAYINQSFQTHVTGSSYTVELVEGDPPNDEPPKVVLTATDPTVTVEVNTTVKNNVEDSFAYGGTITVYYDADEDEKVLVIANE